MQPDGQTETGRQTEEQTDRDRQADRGTDRDRQPDGQTGRRRDRQTEKQTGRQRDRDRQTETDRQTEGQTDTDRQTEGQTDRQPGGQTDLEAGAPLVPPFDSQRRARGQQEPAIGEVLFSGQQVMAARPQSGAAAAAIGPQRHVVRARELDLAAEEHFLHLHLHRHRSGVHSLPANHHRTDCCWRKVKK